MSDFSEIGEALVGASHGGIAGGRWPLTPLFPYIYEASKGMSARAISKWLLNERQQKISDVTISKALRNPEKHWEAFAEYIEPWARTVESSINAGMECFLLRREVFDELTKNPEVEAMNGEDAIREIAKFRQAVDFLRRHWFALDVSTRANCERFFQAGVQPENSDEA